MRIFTGKAVSNKQTKTIIVEVERFFRHPLYERRMRRTKRYQVHTEAVIPLGEVVRFVETKPISKNKRWKVVGEEVQKVPEVSKVSPLFAKATRSKQVLKARENIRKKGRRAK